MEERTIVTTAQIAEGLSPWPMPEWCKPLGVSLVSLRGSMVGMISRLLHCFESRGATGAVLFKKSWRFMANVCRLPCPEVGHSRSRCKKQTGRIKSMRRPGVGKGGEREYETRSPLFPLSCGCTHVAEAPGMDARGRCFEARSAFPRGHGRVVVSNLFSE